MKVANLNLLDRKCKSSTEKPGYLKLWHFLTHFRGGNHGPSATPAEYVGGVWVVGGPQGLWQWEGESWSILGQPTLPTLHLDHPCGSSGEAAHAGDAPRGGATGDRADGHGL